IYGYYTLLSPDDERVFSYIKEYQSECLLVVLNFTKEPVTYALPEEAGVIRKATDFIGNRSTTLPDLESRKIELRPYEGYVIAM
ncbi:hypothetical protein LTR53_014895, partial [Teratosphaeriaceae sp. CCFEE 6253]